MADDTKEWREESVSVDGTNLIVVKGGTGRPMLVLHDELGHPGWLKWTGATAHPSYPAASRLRPHRARRMDDVDSRPRRFLRALSQGKWACAIGRDRLFARRMDRRGDGRVESRPVPQDDPGGSRRHPAAERKYPGCLSAHGSAATDGERVRPSQHSRIPRIVRRRDVAGSVRDV